MNIAILTSKDSWFVRYAKDFVSQLEKNDRHAKLFFDHRRIGSQYEIVFVLSYFNIIEKEYLVQHRHNIIVHESALPQGRGWAPLFWQILEGKNKIPIVLFEATEKVDQGPIYFKSYLMLRGDELHQGSR